MQGVSVYFATCPEDENGGLGEKDSWYIRALEEKKCHALRRAGDKRMHVFSNSSETRSR